MCFFFLAEPWMQNYIMAYYKGKNKLAVMMGRDPAYFTDQDVKEALAYLLPSPLTEHAARPMLVVRQVLN